MVCATTVDGTGIEARVTVVKKGFRHPAAVGHSDHGGRYDAVDSPHRAVALAGIRATRECLPTRSMERGTGNRSGHFG